MTGIWSIGHSNHAMPRFLELLRRAEVAVVVGVRSQPFSRFSPHFRRRRLQAELAEDGLGYVFLGEELGGRGDGSTVTESDLAVRLAPPVQSALFGGSDPWRSVRPVARRPVPD